MNQRRTNPGGACPSGIAWTRRLSLLAALTTTMGCDTGAKPSDRDAGPLDSGMADAATDDAGSPDAGRPTCSGDAPDALFGVRRSLTEHRHTLLRTETATVLGILPPGEARRAAMPELFEITRVCGDQQILVARDASQRFVRIDYHLDNVLYLCLTERGLMDEDAALAATPADRSSILDRGCDGRPFTRLEAIR